MHYLRNTEIKIKTKTGKTELTARMPYSAFSQCYSSKYYVVNIGINCKIMSISKNIFFINQYMSISTDFYATGTSSCQQRINLFENKQ